MAIPINPSGSSTIREKIGSSASHKTRYAGKTAGGSNISSSTGSIEINDENLGVKLEISGESRIKSEELKKKSIDSKEGATDLLNSIKKQTGNLTKAQARSTPQRVIDLLA